MNVLTALISNTVLGLSGFSLAAGILLYVAWKIRGSLLALGYLFLSIHFGVTAHAIWTGLDLDWRFTLTAVAGALLLLIGYLRALPESEHEQSVYEKIVKGE